MMKRKDNIVPQFNNDHLKWNSVWQIMVAMIFIYMVLYTLRSLATSPIVWAVGAGSLASSSYLVFTQPTSPNSQSLRIICSYLIGILIGEVIRSLWLNIFPDDPQMVGNTHFYLFCFFSVGAVGISILLMIWFGFTHPPAVGMALISVIDIRDYMILIVILCSAFILSVLHYLLKPWLKDL